MQTRRHFLAGVAGRQARARLDSSRHAIDAESPPETTSLRISHSPSLCAAPQFVAEDLLRGEGFSSITYVKSADAGPAQWRDLASGEIHFGTAFSGPLLVRLDAQDPIVLLAGIHVGCFELFGTDRVRAVRDLKGKTVAVWASQSVGHVFLSAIAATSASIPERTSRGPPIPRQEVKRLLAEGKVDAYMAFPSRSPGAARQRDRPRRREQRDGQALVAVLLLHAGRQPRVRPEASRRDEARPARAPEGDGPLCREPERMARLLVDRGT